MRTDKISTEQLLSEFHKIQALPEIYSYGLKTTDKYLVQSISNLYFAHVPAAQVSSHYKAELLKNGWHYRSDFHGGDHWGEGYCKGRIYGGLEFIPGQNPKEIEYDFSVAVTSSDPECK